VQLPVTLLDAKKLGGCTPACELLRFHINLR
jgi:hypothetical protein